MVLTNILSLNHVFVFCFSPPSANRLNSAQTLVFVSFSHQDIDEFCSILGNFCPLTEPFPNDVVRFFIVMEYVRFCHRAMKSIMNFVFLTLYVWLNDYKLTY